MTIRARLKNYTFNVEMLRNPNINSEVLQPYFDNHSSKCYLARDQYRSPQWYLYKHHIGYIYSTNMHRTVYCVIGFVWFVITHFSVFSVQQSCLSLTAVTSPSPLLAQCPALLPTSFPDRKWASRKILGWGWGGGQGQGHTCVLYIQ